MYEARLIQRTSGMPPEIDIRVVLPNREMWRVHC
jgi:hypothetical protein